MSELRIVNAHRRRGAPDEITYFVEADGVRRRLVARRGEHLFGYLDPLVAPLAAAEATR